FAAPAPAGSFSNPLSILNGSNPNGTWALYVLDDSPGDQGSISGGWTLSLTTTNLACCSSGSSSDLSVTLTDSPDPVVVGQNLSYSAVVVNNGPANATGVTMQVQL